jgi:3-methyladenine DNA glycosylase/8-oxoguanine DNA glycosylase
MPFDAARARLEAIPGIGPWTSAKVAASALGDADAVPVGDFHLPNTIVYAFTGDARGDDARMLELLAPYAGHRMRVIRLIEHAGIHAPRYGPRRPLRKWRSQ